MSGLAVILMTATQAAAQTGLPEGGGELLRYTRGSVEFPTSTEAMIVGGVQLGVGLRARF